MAKVWLTWRKIVQIPRGLSVMAAEPDFWKLFHDDGPGLESFNPQKWDFN